MSELDKLRALLCSDDLASRTQGIELARALGDGVIAQLLGRARITPKPIDELFGARSWLARYLPKKIPQVVAPGKLGTHGPQTALSLASRSQCRTARKLCSVSRLGLNGNHDVLDLSPLSELDALRSLALVQARSLTCIETLGNLAELESLFLAQIDELHLTALPPSLRKMFVHSKNEARVRLEGLPKLSQLVVRSKTFRLDGSSLLDSSNLDTVAVASMGTSVANRADLSRLGRLRTLELMNADVTDVAWVPKNVRTLALGGATSLVDLTGLPNLTKLERLDLSSTAIDDWRPIAALPALKQLSVRHTKVHDSLPPELEAKSMIWYSKWT